MRSNAPARVSRALPLVLATVLVLLAYALRAASADAATYNVVSCNDAAGQNHSWHAWWSNGSSTIVSGASCIGGDYDGNTNKGLFTRYVANSTDPGGAAGGVAFDAPTGDTIASVALSDWISRTPNNGPYAFLASNYGMLEGCFNGTNACGAALPRHTLTANGATQIRSEVGCATASCTDTTGNGTAGIIEIYGATVTVNDLTSPTTSASGQLWTSAWQNGVRTVTASGGDGADGIQRNELAIDGTTVASKTEACDFSYATPCPTNAADTFSYDTRQLTDGPHTLHVTSYDAGWLSDTLGTTINVDNHTPSKPTAPTLQGAGGWHATNGFSVNWTDPGQGAASPIAAVHYSLCSATNPTSCPVSDQRVAGNAISSLSNINVPGPGDWVLRAWLEDAAGNADPAATSDPVHLMFDPQAPGLAEAQHNNGWLNAQNVKNSVEPIQLASGVQPGASGIAGYAVTLNGTDPGSSPNAVTTTGTRAIYSIPDLPEGRNVLKVRAISGAGVPSSQVGSTEIDVDKTPPTTTATGAPDPEQWQNAPVALMVKGTDQPDLSGMAPSSDSTETHGAYMSYRIDGGDPQLVPGGSAQVRVAQDGEHTVSYQAYDFAGNPSLEKSIRVKVDTTPPSLVAFEAPIPGDPRRLIVAAADRTSGIASGLIEIRESGTTSWRPLPTSRLSDSEFTTYVDDTKLDPHATYELRARVTDAAGNEATASAYADGRPVILPGQLRTATHVGLGSPAKPSKCKPKPQRRPKRGKRSTRRRCSAHHKGPKRHRSKRRVANSLRQAIDTARRHAKHHYPKKPAPLPQGERRVPFGKTATISGTLTTVEGAPISNQALAIYATLRAPGAQPGLEARVRTDARGGFKYVAHAGASRTLDFRFEGTDSLYPSDAPLQLLVPASTSFRASRRTVPNGHSVTFRGRLRGHPLPSAGKLVNLQVHFRGRWRTFATPRANATGAWRFTYRFQATRGVVHYRFRAQVKREAAYPYELGYSRPIEVTVRG